MDDLEPMIRYTILDFDWASYGLASVADFIDASYADGRREDWADGLAAQIVAIVNAVRPR